MSPIQGSLFDPALLTTDGMPRDCPCCKGSGYMLIGTSQQKLCGNCEGTGRARIPY